MLNRGMETECLKETTEIFVPLFPVLVELLFVVC